MSSWRLHLDHKGYIITVVVVAFMVGFVPIGAEEIKTYDYELILDLDDNWGNPVVDGFDIKLNGMDMYRNYGCKVYQDKNGCELINILQNEKIIDQNDKIIERLDTMIAQNKKMLDAATVEDFDDWYP